ncbi:MAG: ATP-binding cassette domain-containing protein [candidate division KSB1 bacterium]|nr:ATP-binding cassette domain-containing protein [candidate division KSB1 bacterium]
MEVLSLRGVSKAFGEVQAVSDLSLTVEEGKVFGLLGPNGAGKTTTIRMVMNIIGPDSGEIRVLGKPNHDGVLHRVGYLPEERGLYPKVPVEEVLELLAVLRGLSRAEARRRIQLWLERFGLGGWGKKRGEQLSKGMQQKVMLIGAILHEPELVILDEPFAGLDPVSATEAKDAILELVKRGTTVILSTHQMEQVEKLCDDICLINHGRAVLVGTVPDVKKRFGEQRVILAYDGTPHFLEDRSLVAGYDDYGHYVEIRPARGVSPHQILQRAVSDVEVRRFEVREPSLNEIFITVVKGAASEVEP